MSKRVLKIAIRKFDGFERSIIEQFEAWRSRTALDVTLEWQSFDVEELAIELFDRSTLANGIWDIAFVCTDWLATAAEGRHLFDLAPMMKIEPVPDYPSGWSPALLKAQTRNGTVMGLPYHDGPQCLIYRRDLIEDPSRRELFQSLYGKPLEIPRNWHDFFNLARFLSDPVTGRYGTIVAAYPDAHNTVYDFLIHLWTRGGNFVDPDGVPSFDTPIANQAISFYRDMVRTPGLAHPDFATTTSVTAGNVFAAGGAALMTNWFSCAAYAQLFGAPEVRGNIGVAPIPGTSPQRPASLLVYWLLAIGSGSKEPELAYDFLRHVASADMDRVTTLSGGIGTRRSTWSDPEVLAAIPFYNQMEHLHATARMPPLPSRFVALGAIINQLMHQAATTEIPVQSLLQQAQTKALTIQDLM